MPSDGLPPFRHAQAREQEPKRSHRRVEVGERGVALLLVDHREGGGEARQGYWDLCDALQARRHRPSSPRARPELAASSL